MRRRMAGVEQNARTALRRVYGEAAAGLAQSINNFIEYIDAPIGSAAYTQYGRIKTHLRLIKRDVSEALVADLPVKSAH